MAPHSSALAWKIPWTEEPGRLQSMVSWRVWHDWSTYLSLFTFMLGEGNGNPLQCSCLENPRDGGAWQAAIYGVAQSQTRLKWLSSSSSSSSSRVQRHHSFSLESTSRILCLALPPGCPSVLGYLRISPHQLPSSLLAPLAYLGNLKKFLAMVFFLSSYKGFKKSFFKNGNLTFRLFWKPLQPKIAQAKVLIAPSPTCPYVIFWIGKMLNISFNKCSEAKWSQQAWHLHSLFNHDFASLFQMKIDSLSMRGKNVSLFFLPFVYIYSVSSLPLISNL